MDKMKKPSLAAEVSPTDHVRGSPFAQVTLVGYGDFACPECATTYRTVKTIQRKLGARLRYVFRSFPQPERYENSEEAAEAAECASAQGKFWEMHDCMFQSQGEFDELYLARCARELGLDLRQFRREMREHAHRRKIRAVRRAGVRRGVVAAPTFFIDCSLHKSAFGLTTLLAAVQAAAGDS